MSLYGRHELVLSVGGGHYWGKAVKISWTMPRAARQAEGRRHVKSDGRRHQAILAASTRSWALANRRRPPYARKSWPIASRPSRRTRCRSIAPGVLIHEVIKALDAVIPKDCTSSAAYQAYFNADGQAGGALRRSVNSAQSATACATRGVAAARARGPRGQVVLFEGDGLYSISRVRDAQASRISHPDLRDERRRIRLGVSQAARRRHRR